MKNTIKNIMITQNLLSKTGADKNQILNNLYSSDRKVRCVDAVLFDEFGNESEVHTWYIPQGIELEIKIEDILVVEQTTDIGLAFVIAVSNIYTITEEEHIEKLHPYCKVISSLGDIYSDNNKPFWFRASKYPKKENE